MSNKWLADLEKKVEAAASELARLRGENEELRASVEELKAASADPAEAGWRDERDEVRERVGRLVETLESTLGALD